MNTLALIIYTITLAIALGFNVWYTNHLANKAMREMRDKAEEAMSDIRQHAEDLLKVIAEKEKLNESKYEEHYITQEGLENGDYHCPIIQGDCIYKNCLGDECSEHREFKKEVSENQ